MTSNKSICLNDGWDTTNWFMCNEPVAAHFHSFRCVCQDRLACGRTHYVLNLRHLLVCSFTSPSIYLLLKSWKQYSQNKWTILMPTGTNGPRGNGMKRSILGIKQSKEKCFQFSTLLCQPSFSTSTCAETISVAVARENGYIRRGQVLDDDDVKVQGHTRPKIDLDSGLMEALFSTPLSVWVWVARFHNPAWFRR